MGTELAPGERFEQRGHAILAMENDAFAQNGLARRQQTAFVDLRPPHSDTATVDEHRIAPVDRFGERGDSFVADRRGRDHRWLRHRYAGAKTERQHVLEVGDRARGIGLVALADDVNVGNFEDPGLDCLDIVAKTRCRDHDRRMCRPRDFNLLPSHAYRFYQPEIEAARIEHVHRLERAPGKATERPAGRHAAHEHPWVNAEFTHPDPVAQYGPARTRR